MARRHKTEKTVQYVNTVDTLPEAWAFVMEKIDEVGPSPSIHIEPISQMSALPQVDEEEGWVTVFQVSVSGMVEVEDDGE